MDKPIMPTEGVRRDYVRRLAAAHRVGGPLQREFYTSDEVFQEDVARIWGRYWNGDPKEIITVLILAVYAGYLWLGRTGSWRGARASALCVFNFILVLFSYSVVNLNLSNFHRFF